MKSEELILKTFPVKKTNLHSNQYLIPSKLFQDRLRMASRVFRREKNMRGENWPGRFED